MSNFVLKIIALISMSCDHLGYFIFGKFSFMNYIGRLSFPIFSFLLTEGYTHTHNLKKYFFRLVVLAIISQIPYMLFTSTIFNKLNLNILFTLILGLFSITVFNKSTNKLIGFLFVVVCAIIAHLLPFDYGWFGIAIIFIFYIFKEKKLYMNIFFSMATFINYFHNYITTSATEYLFIILFCILSLIPINLYNHKKGKNIKYILYIFYPLHFVLLYILTLL